MLVFFILIYLLSKYIKEKTELLWFANHSLIWVILEGSGSQG